MNGPPMGCSMKASALVLVLLGGCAAPGVDEIRDDELEVIVRGDAYQVAVPLPIDAALSLDDWRAVMRASNGNGTVAIGDSPIGPALWINGTGTVVAEALMARMLDCCADAYIDGTWSAEGDDPLLRLPIWSNTSVEIALRYDASSCRGQDCGEATGAHQICSLTFRARGAVDGEGDITVDSDAWQCTAAP